MTDVFDELNEINTPVVIKDGKIQRINFRPFLDALYDRVSTKPILRTRNILEFMSSLQGKNKSSGKNGNHITLSSVSPYRGLCTYWTSTEEIKEQNKSEEYVIPKFFSVEINEPYDDEPWYHFIMDLNRPECNLHAVVSKDSINY